jgi:hypothetical protein
MSAAKKLPNAIAITFKVKDKQFALPIRKYVRDVLLNLGCKIQIANELDLVRNEYITNRKDEYRIVILDCSSTSAPVVATVKDRLDKAGYRPTQIDSVSEVSDE